MEVVGEEISHEIAQQRDSTNQDHIYKFRLDEERVIDTSFKGGSGRFLNHSCSPNAFARVVDINSEENEIQRKFLIFSTNYIPKETEITIDYRLVQNQHGIPCHCGSTNCVGSLL